MTEDSALELAREIMTKCSSFVLATADAQGRPYMRWMGAIVRDPQDEWTLYMEAHASSRKIQQITSNPAAQLLYTCEGYSHILTLDGVADVVQDPQIRKMVYEGIPGSSRFFSGPEDPALGVIRFRTTALEVYAHAEGGGTVRVELSD